jgi:citrate lyase beta subunit
VSADRARRSLLYVPASSEAMLRKAGTRGADVLVVDLEDGVLPEVKAEARGTLLRLFSALDFGACEALVRVNAAGTPWADDDLDAVRRLRPAGVVLPKCEDPAAVAALARHLDLPLWLMVETAAGILRAAELARVPGVSALVFGAADFRESVRAGRHPEELELLFARSQLVLAARAAGVLAFDTPWFEYRDAEGLRRSAEIARLLGFDGKSAVHPGQVATLNQVFAPAPAEVERARRVLAALAEAEGRGRGVATLDGEMIEALHGRAARRTLAQAGVPPDAA